MVRRHMKSLLRKIRVKNQTDNIKSPNKIATFAYEEFFEGYATRRRIIQ